MSKQYSLDSLKKLSQIETAKDIGQLSYAQFPGTHCPLFGVALTAGYVEELTTLIVGTDECTYYTKTFTMERENANAAMKDNFLSFAINQDDVVFGCHDKLVKVLKKIDQEQKPKAILLVTTCVLELIGEDFDALIYSMQEEIEAKLLLVRTEHFKCNSHIPGIERTLEAFSGLMERQTVERKSINILGHRYDGVENTELMKLLQDAGIEINVVLPSKCCIDSIKRAPRAELNIVTDFSALPLAEKMKNKFGTEYVYFDKYLSIDRIEQKYIELGDKLSIDISSFVEERKAEAQKAAEQCKVLFAGKTFIYGNTPMLAFEVSSFLCSLGMEPIIVQARDLYRNDDIYMKEILDAGYDPYVSKIANIAPLQTLYDTLKPNIYIGHENPRSLTEKGIIQVVLDVAAKKLGYEVPITVMKMFIQALHHFESMSGKEKHHAAI